MTGSGLLRLRRDADRRKPVVATWPIPGCFVGVPARPLRPFNFEYASSKHVATSDENPTTGARARSRSPVSMFMLELTSEQQALAAALMGPLLIVALWRVKSRSSRADPETHEVPLLECIRARRSVFPRSYVSRPVPPATMRRLLEAAMWAPYHGPVPPWRFVVLGRQAMVDMQRLTLEFYDAHWDETGWANRVDYLKWRARTEEEISGRWGPVSYMVAIVLRRQAGSKRLPEWEEAAATACAVQNMYIQAGAHAGLACYWSSWHDAARESEEMRRFLGMGGEDRCLGFFVVAACEPTLKDSRARGPETHLSVEWRD